MRSHIAPEALIADHESMRKTQFVPFDITVCGIEELTGHCEAGVSHVLSILDPGWPRPEAFSSYREHARLELRFHDIIDERPGEVAPQLSHVEELLAFGCNLAQAAAEDSHLLVHCHAGISRSTAAMTLLLVQARPDRPAAEALAEVVRIRPKTWPNLRMIEMGDRLLGRGGEIVAAAQARYREIATARPDIGRMMAEAGRRREVPHIEL